MVAPILLAGWLLLSAWGTQAHVRAQPVAPPRSATATRGLTATPVVSYGDVAAWSARDAAGRYRLVVRRAGGAPRILPVPSSRRAFDVDLGPGLGGGTWAVYTRCAQPAKGCPLLGTDLATGRERRIGGTAVGRLPAIWGGRLAYFGPARDDRSSLHLTNLGGLGDHAVALHPVAEHELPGALDLRDSRLAYILYAYDDDGYHGTPSLIVAVTDGSGQRTLDTGGSGEECTTSLASPALSAGAVTWLHAALGARGTCRPHPALHRLTFSSGAEERAATPVAPVSAALVGGRALVLAPPPGSRVDVAGREPCRLLRGDADHCDLQDAGAPAWRVAPH